MNGSAIFEKYRNKRCDIIGFGISNRPLAKLLLSAGAFVTVRDKNTDLFSDDLEKAEYLGARFILGEGYLEDIDCDIIFRSPGVRPDIPQICEARKRGSCISSEMEVFFGSAPCRIFGITGSDGKTTTTTLTELFLRAEHERMGRGRSYVGGNIGQPLLPCVSDMTEYDSAVVELSSFQLMTMEHPVFRALITNITPNHLNWHTNMDEYIKAKSNILTGGCSYAVFNADNEITRALAEKFPGETVYFSSHKTDYYSIVPKNKRGSLALFINDGHIVSCRAGECERILKTDDILIPGNHNIENYMAAIGLTYGLCDFDIYRNVARSFKGVRHRLELVTEKNGVRFYNSSIDSSPTRTAAALGAIRGNVVAICGGYDKNIPFDTLASTLCDRARAVVLTGATMDKIYREIMACDKEKRDKLKVICKPNFEDAVIAAAKEAVAGESVVLTPACASFDAFKNFEERGDRFCDIVRALQII